jgi:hypothetical protein
VKDKDNISQFLQKQWRRGISLQVKNIKNKGKTTSVQKSLDQSFR